MCASFNHPYIFILIQDWFNSGWEVEHGLLENWENLVAVVEDLIRSHNLAQTEKAVTYKNEYAKFTGWHSCF